MDIQSREFQEKIQYVKIERELKHKQHYKNDRKAHKKYLWNMKLKVINKYGGKCHCCGVTDPRILSIHHKNNCITGSEGKTHQSYITWRNALREDMVDLEIICHNCNFVLNYYSSS